MTETPLEYAKRTLKPERLKLEEARAIVEKDASYLTKSQKAMNEVLERVANLEYIVKMLEEES